ncbi:MAG: zinc-finger domain-containing protein [Burkholderiaceae bacterium]|nr:zinc-finger domain-containing protein [Burkholderiaceae bacterium]
MSDSCTRAASQPARGLVELDASDLPAHCPNPKMPLWSSHPRVYLDVTHGEAAQCPYCSTVYRLAAGAGAGGRLLAADQ